MQKSKPLDGTALKFSFKNHNVSKMSIPRARTMQERLNLLERQFSFKFSALFHSPIRAVKKGGNFKIDLLMDQMVTFLLCLCSKFV